MVQPAAAAAKPAPGPGIYSATYSGIPVYEYQFGPELKEHVMRRRVDNWINATHILKCAGFDKPARTRILEREVQKDTHEKIQGGYGKYQGTWIPLEAGEQLARRNNVYDRIRPIFEYQPGGESPPPAPRHTSKPKAPRKPAVPKWNNPPPPKPEIVESLSQPLIDDDLPDNDTVASMSYMAEDDRPDMSQFSTGHRKRKREETIQDLTEQQHSIYGDALLDYFLLSRNQTTPSFRPEPPTDFQPDWPIDAEKHSALHWASAMGDVDVIKQMKRFGANVGIQNQRGETPLMRSVNFTNCYEKQTFPSVLKELIDTVEMRDDIGYTVIHHATVIKSGRVQSQSCSRYYLDSILNKLQETHDNNYILQLLNLRDAEGNTALHLATRARASKCIRALLGRGADPHILNAQGISADEVIQEINATRHSKKEPIPRQRSSSPFGPHSQHNSLPDFRPDSVGKLVSYSSEAANTIQGKIGPMIQEKIKNLALNFENQWKQKTDAANEARRLLGNTQNELDTVHQQIAHLEAALEPPEVAAAAEQEAAGAEQELLSLLERQSRYYIHGSIEQSLAFMNGDQGEDSYDGRLKLAHELRDSVAKQRQAEHDYANALGHSGTGEKIDKYRRLLKQCLDRQDADNLDAHIDDLIEMMEEERSEGAPSGAVIGDTAPHVEGDPMMLG
ncbi:ANK-repeat protein MBP1 [Xylariaceae sp. FL1272]|nr:ANK-repeat protein MBP1 [Xylariaceae sp. FL1272]